MSFIVNEETSAPSTHAGSRAAHRAGNVRHDDRAPDDGRAARGQFLGWLPCGSRNRGNVLEIGTFTGYSSISMALALPDGGRITSLDVNEETTAVARRYAEEAVSRTGSTTALPALDTLAELDGRWDLVFIDADKPNYVNYYEDVLPKLGDDGFIVADNVRGRGGSSSRTPTTTPRRSRPSTTTSQRTTASSS